LSIAFYSFLRLRLVLLFVTLQFWEGGLQIPIIASARIAATITIMSG